MSLRYLDEFVSNLQCAPTLLELGLYPNAKEITESMGLYRMAHAHFGDVLRSADAAVPGDDGLLDAIVVVGDGATPRTAAMFAFRSTWRCVSVDPLMRSQDLSRWAGVDKLTCLPGKIEEFVIRARRAIVLLMHAHVSIDMVLDSLEVQEVLAIVACPCCDFGRQQAHVLGTPPAVTYTDLCILSEQRELRLWQFTPAQGARIAAAGKARRLRSEQGDEPGPATPMASLRDDAEGLPIISEEGAAESVAEAAVGGAREGDAGAGAQTGTPASGAAGAAPGPSQAALMHAVATVLHKRAPGPGQPSAVDLWRLTAKALTRLPGYRDAHDPAALPRVQLIVIGPMAEDMCAEARANGVSAQPWDWSCDVSGEAGTGSTDGVDGGAGSDALLRLHPRGAPPTRAPGERAVLLDTGVAALLGRSLKQSMLGDAMQTVARCVLSSTAAGAGSADGASDSPALSAAASSLPLSAALWLLAGVKRTFAIVRSQGAVQAIECGNMYSRNADASGRVTKWHLVGTVLAEPGTTSTRRQFAAWQRNTARFRLRAALLSGVTDGGWHMEAPPCEADDEAGPVMGMAELAACVDSAVEVEGEVRSVYRLSNRVTAAQLRVHRARVGTQPWAAWREEEKLQVTVVRDQVAPMPVPLQLLLSGTKPGDWLCAAGTIVISKRKRPALMLKHVQRLWLMPARQEVRVACDTAGPAREAAAGGALREHGAERATMET